MISLEPPLPGIKFLITLDPADAYLPPAQAILLTLVSLGGFQQCSGLEGELELLAHPEGGVNDHVHQLPVRHQWSRIVLSRGVIRDPGLWYWYDAGLRQSLGARRDGAIILLTPQGIPAMTWIFRGGLAAKWTGPTLHAQEDQVAIESLEIAHHGLERILLSPPEVEV